MKDPKEKNENKDKETKDKSIFNIESHKTIYPSAIQSLFERLGLE